MRTELMDEHGRWNSVRHIVAAVAVTILLYLLVALLPSAYVRDVFWQRGPIQVLLCLLAFYALSNLAQRIRAARRQRAGLRVLSALWESRSGSVDPSQAAEMLDELSAQPLAIEKLISFQAAQTVLVRYRQTGYVADGEEGLRGQISACQEMRYRRDNRC